MRNVREINKTVERISPMVALACSFDMKDYMHFSIKVGKRNIGIPLHGRTLFLCLPLSVLCRMCYGRLPYTILRAALA